MRTGRDHHRPAVLTQLTDNPYARVDQSDDSEFYAVPRLVTHIEAGAIASLRGHYGAVLPHEGRVLDLMSSWRSHLPSRIATDRVVALGMNPIELLENPQVGCFVVHDLNKQPALPFASHAFAGAGCAVSVQYLLRPVEVFREVRRVLRAGSPFVVSFSNRCFPTKAVFSWLTTSDAMHRRLVTTYLQDAGFADVRDASLPTTDDPMCVVTGRA